MLCWAAWVKLSIISMCTLIFSYRLCCRWKMLKFTNDFCFAGISYMSIIYFFKIHVCTLWENLSLILICFEWLWYPEYVPLYVASKYTLHTLQFEINFRSFCGHSLTSMLNPIRIHIFITCIHYVNCRLLFKSVTLSGQTNSPWTPWAVLELFHARSKDTISM